MPSACNVVVVRIFVINSLDPGAGRSFGRRVRPLVVKAEENDASPPCALLGVSPAIFGLLTTPSSLAARGGGQRLNPFPCGLGSGPAGLAAVGQAPVVQDLVELRFHNFLPLFCRCGTRHQFCVSTVSLPKG
jgi:hypothetical protein